MILSGITTAKLGDSQVDAIYKGSTPVWYGPAINATGEVNSWLAAIAAARSANGGAAFIAPSQTVIDATTSFLSGLYASGIRSKIWRLNLFNGGDWSSSFIPIIRDVGNTTWDYNGTKGSTAAQLLTGPFTSSMWSLPNGFDASAVNSAITGKTATGAYLDTGISTANSTFLTSLQNYSLHAACYVNTLGNKVGTLNDLTEIGYYGGNSSMFFLRANYKPYYVDGTLSTAQRGTPGFYTYNGSASPSGTNALVYTASGNSFDPRGFSVGTRTNVNYTAFYKNASLPAAYFTGTSYFYNPNFSPVSYGTITSTSTVAIFCDSASAALGAAKNANSFSDRAISMYSIGAGLTDYEVSVFTSLVQNFNTAIGRTNY